jgi:rubredoxin
MSHNNFKTYICIVCGFVYDEAIGRVEDGIAPGTLWTDVPEDWTCPDCGVAKADFEVVSI